MQLRILAKILAIFWIGTFYIHGVTAQGIDSSGVSSESLPPPAPASNNTPLTPSPTAFGSSSEINFERVPENLRKQIAILRARGAPEQTIQQLIRRYVQSGEIDSLSPSLRSEGLSGVGFSGEGDTARASSQEDPKGSFSLSNEDIPSSSFSYEMFMEQQLIEQEKRKLLELERRKRLNALAKRAQDSVAFQEESVFGQHIFSRKYRFFNWQLGIIPQDDYLLGPGDRLIVAVWGSNELFETLTVDEDGTVLRQYLGKIPVAGYKFKEVVSTLTREYRNFVGDANIDISLDPGPSKVQIKVDLVGNIQRPGPYAVDPGIDALRAIFDAGGVSEKGSVRNIEIIRNGRRRMFIDLYDYLLEGNDMPKLEEGDHVVVPVQGKIVEVSGDVTRPMLYELQPGEDLKKLITYAGGIAFDARTSYVKLVRFLDGRREIMDFDLGELLSKGHDFPLENGDQIIISKQTNDLENVVEVLGNVKYPGYYPFKVGHKISDLISEAGGLDTATFFKRAYLIRKMESGDSRYLRIDLGKTLSNDPSHNFLLQNRDILQVFSQRDFNEVENIAVSGLVRKPDTFLKTPNMTLKDMIYLAGGFLKDADLNSIELSSFKLNEVEDPTFYTLEDSLANKVVKYVSVSENWQDDLSLDTLFLEDFEEVRVYSKYDFGEKQMVSVEGAVENSGTFQVNTYTSLKSLIYQAGGIGDEEVRNIELYRRIYYDEKGKFGTRSVKPEIVRINIDRDWQRNSLLDSILVQPYYKVVLRSENSFAEQGYVMVKGMVGSPGKYTLSPNMTLKDLLYQSGGIRLGADVEKIELTRVIEVDNGNGEIQFIPIKIRQISAQQDWENDNNLDDVFLNAYDEVYIRSNPEFKLQESIFIEGEVVVPGEYTKISKDERISSLVKRAEGITEIAYPEGAYLIRPSQGPISLRLEQALRNPGSKYNIPLLAGDRLIIPPRTEIVTVNGNVLQPGTRVIFEKGNRNFKHYVNLAGGFDRRTKRKLSTVSYVDGSTRRVRTLMFLKFYPSIHQGSIIQVAKKPPKKEKEKTGEGFKINVQEIIASATAALTFYLILDRVLDDNNNNSQ